MRPSNLTIDPGLSSKSIVRRYIDLPKLLDLLHTKSLYFRRADGFTDRLEGALFPSFRKALDEAFTQGKLPHNSDHFYRRARVGNYVCCWTIGARDNMALWQLYGGVKTSIAITSTIGQLIQCGVMWNRSTHLGKVRYVDHRHVNSYLIGNYADVLQYKSDAYKYENELRLIVPQQENGWESNPIGIRLTLPNLDELVRSVVLAPEADADFLAAVQDLCKRYGLKAPVRRSMLSLVPI